jgi:hypothetical protein
LITQHRDAEAVEIIRGIANKTGRSCSLTLEQLEEEGEIKGSKESLVRTTSRQMKVCPLDENGRRELIEEPV